MNDQVTFNFDLRTFAASSPPQALKGHVQRQLETTKAKTPFYIEEKETKTKMKVDDRRLCSGGGKGGLRILSPGSQ